MGGYNSGRRGGRPTIEGTDSIRLDVNRLVRRLAGKERGGVGFTGSRRGEPFRILLIFDLPGDDEPWQTGTVRIVHASIPHATGGETGKQDYTVALRSTPCPFGGRRWWFICPCAGGRCGTLFLPNGADRFGSREAFGLVYASQRRDEINTGHARLARHLRKLGSDYDGPDTLDPPRPKGMRRRTYKKLSAALAEERERFDQACFAHLAPMLRRAGETP